MRIPGLAAALLLGLAACSTGSSENSESSSAEETTSSTSAESSSSAEETTTSPDSNIETLPSWNFPRSIDGWNIDIADIGGRFRATRDNGCILYTYQARVTGASGSERELSEQMLQDNMDAMTSRGITNLNHEESSDNFVTSQQGGEVEGVASDVSYTGNDGVNYRGWFWYRNFDSDLYSVSLMVNYACPEGEYSVDDARSTISDNLYIEWISSSAEQMQD